MVGVHRVDVLGCPFDAVSMDEAVAIVKRAVVDGQSLQVVPGNVDFVMKAKRNPEFSRWLWESDLVVADGVPVTWAARALGDPLSGRVSGTELVERCAEISKETGCSVALLGGEPGIAEKAAAVMVEANPGAHLSVVPTPMSLDANERRALVDSVAELRPAIVLVALGAPRQEEFVREYLRLAPPAVGIGIGSAFDIIAGIKPRAPRWMCDHGLEWFHRMLQEPERLVRRYLVEDSPFIWHLGRATLLRFVPVNRGDVT